MLQKFIKNYLIIKLLLVLNLYATPNNCIEYNINNTNKVCQYIINKSFNTRDILCLKILDYDRSYNKLEIYINNKLILENNKLLSKSMQDNDYTAGALKNIFIDKDNLVLLLGTLKGNNYIQFTLHFKYNNKDFLLDNLQIFTENFFDDNVSIVDYTIIKELYLSELEYGDFFIEDNIYQYIKQQ